MTALDRYVRLESDALWRAACDAQRRDVVLTFGDATLVISDGAGRPLTHWSLPALIRQNPGDTPAIYVPDEDGSEVLEISDPTMVEAIEEVRKALAKAQPHPGKLRHWLTAGFVGLAILIGVFWLPDALIRQTLSVVPEPKRQEIGARMLGFMQPYTGSACQSARGDIAAQRLAARLFSDGAANEIKVLENLAQGVLALPGGLIIMDARILRLSDDPAAASGFILASRAAIMRSNPLENLLLQEGLATTFRLLTTGNIDPTILDQNAQNLITAQATQPDADTLRSLFEGAQIPFAPYIAASDKWSGNTPNLGSDPLDGQTAPLILNDSDWVALQNICN